MTFTGNRAAAMLIVLTLSVPTGGTRLYAQAPPVTPDIEVWKDPSHPFSKWVEALRQMDRLRREFEASHADLKKKAARAKELQGKEWAESQKSLMEAGRKAARADGDVLVDFAAVVEASRVAERIDRELQEAEGAVALARRAFNDAKVEFIQGVKSLAELHAGFREDVSRKVSKGKGAPSQPNSPRAKNAELEELLYPQADVAEGRARREIETRYVASLMASNPNNKQLAAAVKVFENALKALLECEPAYEKSLRSRQQASDYWQIEADFVKDLARTGQVPLSPDSTQWYEALRQKGRRFIKSEETNGRKTAYADMEKFDRAAESYERAFEEVVKAGFRSE